MGGVAERLCYDSASSQAKQMTLRMRKNRATTDQASKPPVTPEQKLAAIERIVEEINRLPRLDGRSSKELLDDPYDEHGLPK